MISAFARDFPILAIAEQRKSIPAMLAITADVSLSTGKLDGEFIRDLAEVMYPDEGLDDVDLPKDCDARWLSLEDLILAFRPRRGLADVLSLLDVLARRNQEDAEDEDDGEDDGDDAAKATSSRAKGSGSKPKMFSDKRENSTGTDNGSKPKSTDSDNGGRWKKDKPSGAEVFQPASLSAGSGKPEKPPMTVETLSGYGKARDWALDLKTDLADYDAGALGWSDMSTKLLLFGPPGTGKTTFARALCNSLQIPLVVTSVSTWLQGGHLNDVIDKMAKTFGEARALAPCILFIDDD